MYGDQVPQESRVRSPGNLLDPKQPRTSPHPTLNPPPFPLQSASCQGRPSQNIHATPPCVCDLSAYTHIHARGKHNASAVS